MNIQKKTITIEGLGDIEARRGIDETMVGSIFDVHVSLLDDRTYTDKEKGIAFFRETYSYERIHYWHVDFVISLWIADKCIGFGRAKYNGWITHVFVDKNYQGYKLGNLLLREMEIELFSAGINEFYLNAEPRTVKFYERNGWKKRSEETIERQHVILVPMFKTVRRV